MKKLIYILGAVIAFASCEVDVINQNSLTNESFWKTERDADNGLVAAYSMHNKTELYARWHWMRTDVTSDEGWSNSPIAAVKEWTRYTYLNYDYTNGNVNPFRAYYRTIFRANQVLTYVPDIEFTDDPNDERKDLILAQAYFIRGLAFFQLAATWGSDANSIPIITELQKPTDLPQGHNKTEVYAQAIDDFTEAIDLGLPTKWDAANVGRVTEGGARGFRAKAYMQQRMFDDAMEDLEWFLDGEGASFYGLMPNYAHNFDIANENNKESVFEIQFSDDNEGVAGDGDGEQDPNLGNHRKMLLGPRYNDLGWGTGYVRPWVVDSFKVEKNLNGGYDIRLKHSVAYKGMHNDFPDNNIYFAADLNTTDIWTAGGNNMNLGGVPFCFYRKFISEDPAVWEGKNLKDPTNIRLLRYADILLLYAEALVQTGGSLSTAVTCVDMVRARVNMPPLATNHPQAATNKDAFLERLLWERFFEFVGEGHRLNDMRRFGILETREGVDAAIARDVDFTNYAIGTHECLPIPASEIRNNPNLEQNTGF